MTVYLDVLLLTNLWVDYALLRTTARLTHAPLSRLRCLLAAALGAVCALAIFLPPIPAALCMAGRLLSAMGMSAAAFGVRPLRRLLRQTALLLILSAVFCGGAAALAQLRQPAGWYTQNTVIYADISLLTLLAGTTAASALTSLLAGRAGRTPRGKYRLHLRIRGADFTMPALADTGSNLCDRFTGRPVAVCPASALGSFLAGYADAVSAAASCGGFRLIPVQTASGKTLLPAFRPDAAGILQEQDKQEVPLDILVALTGEQTPALLPADCITAAGCRVRDT